MLAWGVLVWRVLVWRVLLWRAGAHRLAHAPADRSPGGDGDLILLERYVVEGEGGHRTQRGRYIDEPVELRPVWCGVLRGEGCAEAQGDACSVCTGMWRCVLLQGGCVRGRACASVIECVDALTNRSSFLLSKNTSLATALPPELRST